MLAVPLRQGIATVSSSQSVYIATCYVMGVNRMPKTIFCDFLES